MYIITLLINTICIYFHIISNAGEDDLSSTGNNQGNAGARIACGVISQRVGEFIALSIWYPFELNPLSLYFIFP